MKVWKVMVITVLLAAFGLLAFGCSGTGETDEPQNQEVTVERGNLTIDITAAGNLALSLTDDPAFEIAGTVAEVLVEEGDSVVEGQVLARLDTGEWEDNLKTLKDKLTAAERQLTAKERALASVEHQVSVKELSVREAQLNLEKAEYNLSQIGDVKDAQDAIDQAEWALEFAESMLAGHYGGGLVLVDFTYWLDMKANAGDELERAQDYLAEVLAGSRITLSSGVALEVAERQLLVDKKRIGLDDARLDVEDVELDVVDARLNLEDAKNDVEDARSDLDEALDTSLEITAPFDSFVTNVNVEGGDEVKKGTVAVQLADPDKFEAEVLVGEMDISQVKLGGEALVQVDALSGLTLPAKVTHISPTATIQQGVVNYQVKVAVQSLEAVMQERQEARQPARPEISAGELPERMRQAIEEGRITQEQAEAMMSQRQQGEGSPLSPGQIPMVIPEDFQLREGLTVIVSIIVDEATDVLLVPNQAITHEGGQTLVQLMKDGVIKPHPVKVGISDWQFTEVTEGLSEGDTVVVTGATGTTVTTPSESGQGGQGMFIPGMGRPH